MRRLDLRLVLEEAVATLRSNGGKRCPPERLDGHRYHDDWLRNLLAHASLNGFRRRIEHPHNP